MGLDTYNDNNFNSNNPDNRELESEYTQEEMLELENDKLKREIEVYKQRLEHKSQIINEVIEALSVHEKNTFFIKKLKTVA